MLQLSQSTVQPLQPTAAIGRTATHIMLPSIANVHDAYFKQILADAKVAGQFLRDHLPPEVVKLLAPQPPEPLPASFVDEQLREHHADLLFRMELKDGGEAFTYLLIEHKSSPDEGARLQLLRYVVRILTNYFEHNNRQLPLPAVLPLLVHQGPEPWTYSCEFVNLFGDVPEPLRPYLPSFQHSLLDLAVTPDEKLSTVVRLRPPLLALKYARRADLPERLGIILAGIEDLPLQDLKRMAVYLDKCPIRVSHERMRQELRRLRPEYEEKFMGWFSQGFFDDGVQQGRKEGRVEGEAKTLVRQLEKRFGPLPLEVRERVLAADLQSLDTWLDRVIDAADLKSVFEDALSA